MSPLPVSSSDVYVERSRTLPEAHSLVFGLNQMGVPILPPRELLEQIGEAPEE
jgi:hypothetical protein